MVVVDIIFKISFWVVFDFICVEFVNGLVFVIVLIGKFIIWDNGVLWDVVIFVVLVLILCVYFIVVIIYGVWLFVVKFIIKFFLLKL